MLIVTEKSGRLANRLILATHLIAFCADRHLTLVNPALEEYAHYFAGTASDLYCRYPGRQSGLKPTARRRRLFFRIMAALPPRLERTPARGRVVRLTPGAPLDLADWQPARVGPVFLAGYGFQYDPHLPARHAVIRDYFRPVPEVGAAARSAAGNARQGGDVLIGVHVRHGDYRTWEGGRWFLTLAQYASIMHRAIPLFPGKRVKFLLCSDEAQDTRALDGLPFAWGPGGEASDLFALAECDYLIGSAASTYVRWAAFYGAKPLYPVSDWKAPMTRSSFRVPDVLKG